MKGLEPILLTEPDPKSGAATNYATSARPDFSGVQKYVFFRKQKQIFQIYFLTFNASRKALPISMKASTSSMMAMPGRMARYALSRMM